MMRALRALLPLCLLITVGCSEPLIHPYRIEVQQGNFVDQDMLDQIRPGMNKDQVQFVLGTPLLVDPFNAQRWDYIYAITEGQRAGVSFFQKPRRSLLYHLVLVFEGDILTDIQILSEVPPSELALTPAGRERLREMAEAENVTEEQNPP